MQALLSQAYRSLLEQLRSLDEAQLSRVGLRAYGSEVNAMGIVAQLVEHDRDHVWRICAILRERVSARSAD